MNQLFYNIAGAIVHQVRRAKRTAIESLNMTFTADGKRQRLPLILYSFHFILK